MTALAGFWSFASQVDPARSCERMLQAQQIYGRETSPAWRGGDLAIGKRLHPTLAEDAFDRGVVHGGGGRWTMAADVRLGDREGLVAGLGMCAEEQHMLSDSALVMKAIERWEEAAIDRLVGEFAVAIWDARDRRLLLARDFLGSRPLHYHEGPGFLAFATMPKGLLALPEVPAGPDTDTVAHFLALMPETDGRSFFRGASRVLPGETLTITRAGVSRRRHWSFDKPTLRLKKAEDYAEAVRDVFDTSVAACLRGTGGRVASHLSGGLDSSAVTATAARLMASEGRVHAYTASPREGYDSRIAKGRFADETGHAAAIAAMYPNVEHHVLRTGARSPFAGLDRHFLLYDRPMLNLCNTVWIDAIYEDAARRKLNVLLTGQLGNMSFSYTGLEALGDLVASGRWLKLMGKATLLRRRGTRLLSVASHSLGPFLPAAIWRAINRLAGRRLATVDHSALRPERIADLAEEAAHRGLDLDYRPRRGMVATRLWALGRVDRGPYQKGALAGWGIDVRDPTADRRLIELCLSIPAEQYIADGYTRALARRTFTDRLPEIVVWETRKGYQAADWHEGLVADWESARREADRLAALPIAEDIIDTQRLARLLEEAPHADWNSPAVMGSYRLALMRGLSAGHFLRKASGSNL